MEVHNARIVGHGNEEAAAFAREHALPGVAVSDAHSVLEVGVAYTTLEGDPSTPGRAGSPATWPGGDLVTGRATYGVRLWTPIAKGINRLRGNNRMPAARRDA